MRSSGSRVYCVGSMEEGQYHVTHANPAFQVEGVGCRAWVVTCRV